MPLLHTKYVRACAPSSAVHCCPRASRSRSPEDTGLGLGLGLGVRIRVRARVRVRVRVRISGPEPLGPWRRRVSPGYVLLVRVRVRVRVWSLAPPPPRATGGTRDSRSTGAHARTRHNPAAAKQRDLTGLRVQGWLLRAILRAGAWAHLVVHLLQKLEARLVRVRVRVRVRIRVRVRVRVRVRIRVRVKVRAMVRVSMRRRAALASRAGRAAAGGVGLAPWPA